MNRSFAQGNWKNWQQRLAYGQLLCSLFMQTSYVAFPSYNFVIALWSAFCTTYESTSRRTWAVLLSVIPLSIITDIIWASLWTSAGIFVDRTCNRGVVGILSCSGVDYFPGCHTNRFAFVMMILNVILKFASIVSITKVMKQDDYTSHGGVPKISKAKSTAEIHHYPLGQMNHPTFDEEKLTATEPTAPASDESSVSYGYDEQQYDYRNNQQTW